jgi:hypothetical protein
MDGKVIPIRSGRRRRPLWFDIEDRERLVVRLRIIFQGYWNALQSVHKEFPPTGFAKKALQAAAAAEKAGGSFYFANDFMKTAKYDVFGMVIEEVYIDNNAWLENLWFPTAIEFKQKLLWDTLTPDARSKEKWTKRLQVCGIAREDIKLGQDVIVKITQRLCEDILGVDYTEQALEKRYVNKIKRTREKS